MTVLREQLLKVLLPGMYIPQALDLLFSWIEENRLFLDTDKRRIGFLYPQARLKAGWEDPERSGGTLIEFFAEGNVNLKYWFGHDCSEMLNRLCVFAKTGADGSMAAFWLDDEGKQKIVHLGSGSGSVLSCVLADDPIDFIRLIAIGYDEICWHSAYSAPPNAGSEDGIFVYPNTEFQAWVKKTFAVEIPKTALEIVKHPAKMGDTNSPDPFCCWVEQNIE